MPKDYICRGEDCTAFVPFRDAYCHKCGREVMLADVARSQSKFNNRRVEIPLRHEAAEPGERYSFMSEHEMKRYLELATMEERGEIRGLEIQPRFPVYVHDRWDTRHHVFDYFADFRYQRTEDDRWVVEDAKGFKTAMYRLKKRAVEAQYSITIHEV